jgi:hypothetical protein
MLMSFYKRFGRETVVRGRRSRLLLKEQVRECRMHVSGAAFSSAFPLLSVLCIAVSQVKVLVCLTKPGEWDYEKGLSGNPNANLLPGGLKQHHLPYQQITSHVSS